MMRSIKVKFNKPELSEFEENPIEILKQHQHKLHNKAREAVEKRDELIKPVKNALSPDTDDAQTEPN